MDKDKAKLGKLMTAVRRGKTPEERSLAAKRVRLLRMKIQKQTDLNNKKKVERMSAGRRSLTKQTQPPKGFKPLAKRVEYEEEEAEEASEDEDTPEPSDESSGEDVEQSSEEEEQDESSDDTYEPSEQEDTDTSETTSSEESDE